MEESHLLAWELAGIPIVIAGGTVLHFVFAWSGSRPLVGIFGPVNESVWEHLKMAYWPSAAYAGVQIAIIDSLWPNFFLAKAVAVLTMGVVMLGLYFVTTVVLREPAMTTRLVVDGLTFMVAVAAGQLVSYMTMRTNFGAAVGQTVEIGLFALPAVVLAVMTFKPPRGSLFQDQMNGTYGIPSGHQHSH